MHRSVWNQKNFLDLHRPGSEVPCPGIYRCLECSRVVVLETEAPFPGCDHDYLDGTQTPSRWRLIVVYWRAGNPRGSIAADIDITQENQLEAEMEQLTKAMALLRSLVVALLVAMLAFIGYVLYVVLSRPYDPLLDH